MTLDELVVTVGAKIEHGEFQDVFALADHVKEAFEKLTEKIKELWEKGFDITDEVATQEAQTHRLAQIYGLTADQIEQLGWVAKATGGDLEGLLTGMKFLAKNTEAAAQGSKEAMEALKGIKTHDAKGLLSLQDLLENAAEQFGKLENGPEKVARALKLFGRAGIEMIPVLNRGAEGIRELMDEFEASGAALSEQYSAESKLYSAAKKRVGLYKEALETRFAGRNIAVQTKLWQALVGVLKSPGLLRAVDVISRAFGVLLKGLTLVTRAFDWLLQQKGLVEVVLFGIATAFGAIAVAAVSAGASAVASGLAVVASWIAAGAPLWAIAALFVLIADEIYTTIIGGDSLINRIRKWVSDPIDPESNPLVKLLHSILSFWNDVVGAMTDPQFWRDMKASIEPLLVVFRELVKEFGAIFRVAGKVARYVGSGESGLGLNEHGKDVVAGAGAFADSINPAMMLTKLVAGDAISAYMRPQPSAPGGFSPVVQSTVNVTVPPGTDAKGVGDHVRAAVRDELGKHMQDAYAAHGGGR